MTPVAKPRMTRQDKWKLRPAVVRYRAYCDELQLKFGKSYHLPEKLELVFYMPMPSSWSQKKKDSMLGKPHQAKPDIDNLAKGFMDAFKTEDMHVYSLMAEKYWSVEGNLWVGTSRET